MLQSKPLEIGKLRGTIYDFSNVGDELALHVHTEDDVHISIVASGRLKAFGANGAWETEASAGAVLDWQPGQYHGFIALEPNTRLVNIIK